jgi:hypothetical protein
MYSKMMIQNIHQRNKPNACHRMIIDDGFQKSVLEHPLDMRTTPAHSSLARGLQRVFDDAVLYLGDHPRAALKRTGY